MQACNEHTTLSFWNQPNDMLQDGGIVGKCAHVAVATSCDALTHTRTCHFLYHQKYRGTVGPGNAGVDGYPCPLDTMLLPRIVATGSVAGSITFTDGIDKRSNRRLRRESSLLAYLRTGPTVNDNSTSWLPP